MNNSVLYVMGAGMGPLVAIYVILGVLIGLSVFALVRLAILAKRSKKKPAAQKPAENKEQAPAPEKDCANCPAIKEKDAEIAALAAASVQEEAPQESVNCEDCETVASLREQIAELERKVQELESKPATVVYVAQEAPLEEKTLSQSLAAARVAGKSKITKPSIAAYIGGKYGKAVELNQRGAKTGNGKLPLSDNHYVLFADDTKACFTYVYDTPEGGVVSLIRLDKERAAAIAKNHACVSHSTFPKNKANDWYSVVADDTFTEEEYYAIFDASIAYLRGAEHIPEPETVPLAEKTLSESLAAARVVGKTKITKQSIAAYIGGKYGKAVELNQRGAKTGNGKLPLSDNHYILFADDTKACFTYVYDTPEGGVVSLVRLDVKRASALAKKHVCVSHSTFPKNKANDWYSVIADDTFTEEEYYAIFDASIAYLRGEETVEEPIAEKTLSESLAAARVAGKTDISKKSIAAYIGAKYGENAVLNERGAKTANGKLPLSDNHFIFLADGSKVCFTYVYDTPEGGVVSLVRLDKDRAAALAKKHVCVSHSTFPKNKANDWYSVIADDTFTSEEYYAVFDASIEYLRGEKYVAEAPKAVPLVEKTLSESLAAARLVGSTGISKRSVAVYIRGKYGNGVEINERGAKTSNGKLPLSDNHFTVLGEDRKVCFTYVYDTPEGGVVSLVRLDVERASAIAEKHASLSHSTFPKNKANDWYSVVADDTFTEEEYYAVFDASIAYVRGEKTRTESVKEAPLAEKTLSQSLAAARLIGKSDVSKKSIAAYVTAKYAERAEVNERGAKTANGKLPLSDNHFIFLADGSKVCFTYVYDTPEGGVVSLVRLDKKRAAALAEKHASLSHSTFPKNKANDWYSVIADAGFEGDEYYRIFDASIAYLSGDAAVESAPAEAEVAATVDEAPAETPVAETPVEEVPDVCAVGVVNKKAVVYYLNQTYGDAIELHWRKNETANGKLLVPDNHFALHGDERICFSYVYEDKAGNITILVRLGEEEGEALLSAHEQAVTHSAFPRNKKKDWYKIVVDDSFTEREVYAILDRSVKYVLSI